jgi:hypothetical protein
MEKKHDNYQVRLPSPFELSRGLVEDPVLTVDDHDTVFERALPLVLDALDFVVGAQDGVALVVFVLADVTLAFVVGIVEVRVDGVFVIIATLGIVVVIETVELRREARG